MVVRNNGDVRTLRLSGRSDRAIADYSAAIQLDPKSAVAYNYLGIAYRHLGKFTEAEAAYRSALNIDESYALAHLNLGVLCDLYLQQPERALAEFQRYLELAAAPEPQVAAWVKELQRRAGNAKSPSNSAGSSVAGQKAAGGQS